MVGLGYFLRRWVVLEPLILFTTMAFGAYITQQGVYRGKIQELECGEVNCSQEQQDKVERRTSAFISECTIVETVLQVCVMVTAGPWSDTHGRKLAILWSLALYSMSLFSVAILFHLDSKTLLGLAIGWYYIPSVVYGLGGGAYTLFMLCFSYLGDLASREPSTRLVRFTAVETCLGLGTVGGYYLAGSTTRHLGPMAVLLLSGGSVSLALLYGSLRLENIQPGGEGSKEVSLLHRLRGVGRLLLARRQESQGAEGAGPPHSSTARLVIPALCLLFVLQEAPRTFDSTLLYLYLGKHGSFGWSSATILNYKALTTGLSFLGQLLLFPLLLRLLHLPLMAIGVLTVFSRLGHFLLLGLAPSPVLLYAAAAANCLAGVQTIIIRASLASSCRPADLGTVFAVNELVVTLLPIGLSPAASAIYSRSLCEGCLRGSWAVVASVPILLQLPVFLALWLHLQPQTQPHSPTLRQSDS